MSKRAFALILAVMMFIPLLLCSCAGNGNDTETTTAAAGDSTAAETEKTEPDDGWTEIYDDLPKDLR